MRMSGKFCTKRMLTAVLLCLTTAGFQTAARADNGEAEAETLVQAGHWKRARAILDPQVQTHPDDARADYLLAGVKIAFKDFEGALPLAKRAVDLDGNNSRYHLRLGQILGEMASRA